MHSALVEGNRCSEQQAIAGNMDGDCYLLWLPWSIIELTGDEGEKTNPFGWLSGIRVAQE
jgi:hypothetical protein